MELHDLRPRTALLAVGNGQFAVVDESDVAALAEVSWSVTDKGYLQARDGEATVLMHQRLLGVREGFDIDHINGDKLDNRRANLRWATRSENARNTRRRATNTSGFRGVSLDAKRGTWAAYIAADKKRKNLGKFASRFEAAEARAAAERELGQPILRDMNDFQANVLVTFRKGPDRLMNSALGLGGELGEVLELLKKHLFHGKPMERQAVCSELGDVLFYLAALAAELGFTLEEVAEHNIAKLAARYRNGFVPGGGDRTGIGA